MKSLTWAVILAVVLLTGLSALAAPEPDKKEPPAKPKTPDGTATMLDLEYGPHGVGNRLDLYVPKADAPVPVVIWIHGGGWEAGSKENPPALQGLLSKDYAVASINYRLSQEAKYPAQIEDCKAAVRYLRANAKKYNLDPDHFGVFGASAGGHLVALLGTTAGVKELEGDGPNKDVSSAVQCVVDWFGPTDMLQMKAQADEKLKPAFDADSADGPVGHLFGGPVQEKKELAERANPIHYITKDAAPFLIMHGDKDNIVPLGQSKILDDALKAAKVESTLVVVEGDGHGGPHFASPENLKKIQDFLDQHLKPAKSSPPK
ncbi:MAG TPA: alpha/beta hydrolase [Gemmataceae bacterium]|nr:alpha/beta hydrolase [Gemmataceae bacterium]